MRLARMRFWLRVMGAAHSMNLPRLYLWALRRASDCVDWGSP